MEVVEVEILSKEYMIPACSGIKMDVKQGQNITVIDVEGVQVVIFFAEVTGRQNEFLSTGVTIDCNESLELKFLVPRLISRIIADQRHNKNKGFRDPCFFMRSVNLHALRSLTPAGFSGNSAIPEDFPCPSPAGR